MISKISKKNFEPRIWNDFTDNCIEIVKGEHRKGSTFYANLIFLLNGENCADKDLYGHWMSNVIYWSDYDYDLREVYELQRVEKKTVTRTITEEEWKPI